MSFRPLPKALYRFEILPGLDTPYAFAGLILAIVGIGVFEFWLLRRLKWI